MVWANAQDTELATFVPIVANTAPFDLATSHQHDALLLLDVVTCQHCRYTLTFSPGRMAAPAGG